MVSFFKDNKLSLFLVICLIITLSALYYKSVLLNSYIKKQIPTSTYSYDHSTCPKNNFYFTMDNSHIFTISNQNNDDYVFISGKYKELKDNLISLESDDFNEYIILQNNKFWFYDRKNNTYINFKKISDVPIFSK